MRPRLPAHSAFHVIFEMSLAECNPDRHAISRHTEGVLEDDSAVRREVLHLPGLKRLRDKDPPQSMGDINCEVDDAHANIAVLREGLTCRSKQRCRRIQNPDATCMQL
ncbi:hypothetical protein MRX96_036825 [Rhipicephalus microplus]